MRRRMVESVLLSATGRVCAELERLAKLSPDQTIRPVPVFSELATMVQSTRETVSRTISQLEKRGVLRREDGGLRVVAPHRLAELIY
jgi:DNA-binding MarR family transcriptional regulator